MIFLIGSAFCSKQAGHQGHDQAEQKEVFTCPMHPNVISDKPGVCPSCGMDLVLKQTSPVYTCPMHPNVVSDKPGACPICGMDPVLKVSEATTKPEEMTGMISLSQNKQVLANVAVVTVHSDQWDRD